MHRPLIREFLDHFSDDLKASNLRLPRSDLADDVFFDSFAALLKASDALPSSINSFEDLPGRMREACFAVEKLAAPENRELLRGLLAVSGIRGEPLDPPELLALEFFLRRPFSLARFDDLRRDLKARPLP